MYNVHRNTVFQIFFYAHGLYVHNMQKDTTRLKPCLLHIDRLHFHGICLNCSFVQYLLQIFIETQVLCVRSQFRAIRDFHAYLYVPWEIQDVHAPLVVLPKGRIESIRPLGNA